MNSEYYKKHEPIFNSWYIKSLLGEGSFGKVFEIQRQDFGVTYKAALKAITIPQNQSEIKSVMADGMDEASATAYFRQLVEDIVSEFVLMSKLKGNSNIVSYEDHLVVEHTEGIGWDILIRMELLTPLIDHIHKEKLSRKDVIKLGIDLCKALELCQKYNIVHRDIKPENIFISDNGDYKLGDFGIARTLEKTTGALSKKGTYVYMAPEIYRDDEYGSNVDIYSLGIVMYRLLNENRTPFLPAHPAPITHKDREAAIKKRISGAVLPGPANADGRLAEIVLKACAYDPKDRYFAPMEMREELEAILYNKEEAKIIYPKGDDTPIKSVEYIETGKEDLVLQKADKTDLLIGSNIQEPEKAGSLVNQGTVDKTESVFGAHETSFHDGTVSVFDQKTQSIFETPVQQEPAEQKVKTSPKKADKRFGIVVSAMVVIALVFGGLFISKIYENEKESKYQDLLGQAESLYIEEDFDKAISLHVKEATSNGTVTIQYNANGGSGAPASHSVTKDNDGVAWYSLTSTRPSRNGYDFIGWRLENSTDYGIDPPVSGITIEVGNPTEKTTLTYYAQWRQSNDVKGTTSNGTVTIQYNANGGSGAPVSHSVTKDNDGVARYSLTSTRPSRNGYDFLGWRLENSKDYGIDPPGSGITIEVGNPTEKTTLTYYAQWRQSNDVKETTSNGTVTIQYNANGGSGAPVSHSVTKDNDGVARYSLTSTRPSRNGYDFLGWRLENSTDYGIDPLGSGITIEVSNSTEKTTLTYYAQWRQSK